MAVPVEQAAQRHTLRLGGGGVETERIEEARRRIDSHNIDRAPLHRAIQRERRADGGFADAARTETNDQTMVFQIERRFH